MKSKKKEYLKVIFANLFLGLLYLLPIGILYKCAVDTASSFAPDFNYSTDFMNGSFFGFFVTTIVYLFCNYFLVFARDLLKVKNSSKAVENKNGNPKADRGER